MKHAILITLLALSVGPLAVASDIVTEQINFSGLSYGSDEQRVSALKEILRTIPPSVSVGCVNLGSANTKYGPTTESCVKAFQEMHGLMATGAVNEETNRALNAVLEEKISSMPISKSMVVLPVTNPKPLV